MMAFAKKFRMALFVAVISATVLFSGAASAAYIFSENFDSYGTGVTACVANATNWATCTNGAEMISNTVAASGANSLFIDRTASDAAAITTSLGSQTAQIQIKFSIYPVDNTTTKYIYFRDSSAVAGITLYFNAAGNIQYKNGAAWTDICGTPAYTAGHWYAFTVSTTPSKTTDTFDLVVTDNGAPMCSVTGLAWGSNRTNINSISFSGAAGATADMYVDDISVLKAGAITVTAGASTPAVSNVYPNQQDVAVLQLNLSETTSAENVTVSQIAITAGGTVGTFDDRNATSGGDMADGGVCLYNDVGTTSGALDGGDILILCGDYAANNGAVTFSGLAEVIDAGTSENWLLVYDLSATATAAVTETFRATITPSGTTVVGAGVTTGLTTAISGSAITGNLKTVKKGTLTVAVGASTPAVSSVFANDQDVAVLQVNISETSSMEDVTATQIKFTGGGTSGTFDDRNVSAGGDLADSGACLYRDIGTTAGALDGGDTLISCVDYSANNGSATFSGMTETVTAGSSTTNWLLVYDLNAAGSAANSENFRATITPSATTVAGTGVTSTLAATIAGSAITGSLKTIKKANIAISVGASNPAISDVFANAQDVAVLQVNVAESTSTEDVTVTQIKFTASGTIDDRNLTAGGDVADGGVCLYRDIGTTAGSLDGGDTQISCSDYIANNSTVTFSSMTELITAGSSTNWLLVQDLDLTGTASLNETFRASITPSSTTAAGTGGTTGVAASVSGSAITGNYKTVKKANVAVTVGASNPASVDVFPNTQDVAVLQINVAESSSAEDVTVTQIKFTAAGTIDDRSVSAGGDVKNSGVCLYRDIGATSGALDGGDTQIACSDYAANNTTVTFSSMTEVIPAGSSTNWLLVQSLDSTGTASLNETFRASITPSSTTAAGTGVSTGVAASISGSAITGNYMTVKRGNIAVAVGAATPGAGDVLPNAQDVAVLQVTVSESSSAESVTVNSIKFTGVGTVGSFDERGVTAGGDLADNGACLYVDGGGSPGALDGGDTLLGCGEYTAAANGTVTFASLTELLNPGASADWLLVYDLSATGTAAYQENFRASITPSSTTVTGTAGTTGLAATISGSAINGNFKSINRGHLTVSAGAANPAGVSVFANAQDVEVLQINLLEDSNLENVTVTYIAFTASGTSGAFDDRSQSSGGDIANSGVCLYNDNGTTAGTLDVGDTLIQCSDYAANNGVVSFSTMSETINAGASADWLLAYDLNASGTASFSETFRSSITPSATTLTGTASVTGLAATFSGSAITGNAMTIMKGNLSVTAGAANPATLSVDGNAQDIAVLQVNVAENSGNEDVTVATMTFTAAGTIDDRNQTAGGDVADNGICLYLDGGGTPGALDVGDTLIDCGDYSANNGTVAFTVGRSIAASASENWLIVYDMRNPATTTANETFRASITPSATTVVGTGNTSSLSAGISGSAITGNYMDVLGGNINVTVGAATPAASNVASNQQDVAVLQVNFAEDTGYENVTISYLNFLGSGTAGSFNEANATAGGDIADSGVCLYDDVGTTAGALDGGDTLVQCADYNLDNGFAIFATMAVVVNASSSKNLLLVYDLAAGCSASPGDNFRTSLGILTSRITVNGNTTGAFASLSGSTVTSNTMTVAAPNATSFANVTEGALDNLGARTSQSVTVSGSEFGTACSSPGHVVNIGTYEVLCADVTSWSTSSITFSVNSAIDAYGGTATDGLVVTACGATDTTPLDFYTYPNVTALTTPFEPSDNAREYSASDSDGVITIVGTMFGASGTVTILGEAATIDSYSDTSIQARVPASIADNSYTGNVVVTRATPADSKTDTFGTLQILPRITSTSPTCGSSTNPVTVSGDHFCASGVCPVGGSRGDATHNVTFNAGQMVPDADVSAWTDTSSSVLVPAGISTGNMILTSNTLTSNGYNFVFDATPPVQSALNPASSSTVASATPTVTFTLDEAGDCKWSFTDQAYSAMTNDCTGDGTTSISCDLSGLAQGTNTVYFACADQCQSQDTVGSNTAADYLIDTSPPVQSAWSPAKSATVATTSPTITFTTDENGDCKWSLTDDDYATMTNDCTGDGTTSQSCATTGLTEGAEIVYVSCRDTLLNADDTTTNEAIDYTIDTTPPSQSAWIPAISSTIATATQTITFTTDENADCKWSLTDDAYATMTNDCTGDGTTAQTCATAGLIDGAEIVYIACRDTVLNEDSIATNEHVDYTVDTTPPSQSAWSPAKSATVASTSPTITFTTDENGDCKWSLTDDDYATMVNDCTGDGTTSQSCVTAGLTEGAEIVYIACRDTLLNADLAATNEEIDYTVDTTPPTQSAWSPAKTSTIATKTPTITFTTDENADCKWSLTDDDYATMTNDCTGDGTTSQSCATSGLSEGAEIVYIACRDTALNADLAATNEAVDYTVDTTPPVQSGWNAAKSSTVATTSPTITFDTTENADCKWSMTDDAYSAMTNDCTGDGTLLQSCAISGLAEGANVFYIACRDTLLNADTALTNEAIDYTVDTTPPSQSAWNAAKSSTVATTAPTITFTTDENGDCKWSLTDDDYATMTNDCTGDGTTSQTCVTAGLSEGANIVYVACRDTLLNADSIATNEAIDYTVDTTVPSQSAWSPAKTATIATTTPTITFTTNENADCKWSMTDDDYATMTNDCTGDGTTSQSCATSGLIEGSNFVYVACRDTYLNADTIATNESIGLTVDLTPPSQSVWSPVKTSTVATSSPTVTFTTNENADCKWSLTDDDYAAMAGDCSGDGTTSQSCATSGLVDGAEILYVACRDDVLNADTSVTNEEIDYTIDTTSPAQSSWSPAKAAVLATSTQAITFTTDEIADCKWSLTDDAYATMTNDCTGDGTTSQNCPSTGLVDGAEIVYVACRDALLNADSISTNEEIDYTVDTSAPSQSAWSPAKSSTVAVASQTITFATNENADCKWSLTDVDYSAMANDCTGDGTTSQSCDATGFVEGANIVYIACRDTLLNADTAATSEDYDITLDTIPPAQLTWDPAKGTLLATTSPTVIITTNENADCRWSLNDIDFTAMTGDCTGDGTIIQTCAMSGLPSDGVFNVYVACRDAVMNADTAATSEDVNYWTDGTPPTAPSFVYDGTAADQTYTSSSSQLSANWGVATDTQSGIGKYWYAIGKTAGATDVVTWTSNVSTSVTKTGLTLQDGQKYYFSVKAENTVGLTGSATNSNGVTADTVAPTATFTSPAAAGTVSGTVSISATITDVTLVSWALQVGPGIAPATWKDLTSGTSAVTAATIGSWDSTNFSGMYTFKITATDQYGRTTVATRNVNVDNTLSVTGTIPTGKWTFFSLPAQLATTDPADIFTSGSYKIFRWEPVDVDGEIDFAYIYPPSVVAGEGFWVKAYGSDINYTIAGEPVNTTTLYSLPLNNGWNQVGVPFNRVYTWGQVKVKNNGVTYTLDQAATAGLISKTILELNENTQSWTQKDETLQMSPKAGYYVRAYDDVELMFDPGAGLTGGIAAKVVRPTFEYVSRLSVSTPNAADTDNFIGAQGRAAAEFDELDYPEPPGAMNDKYVSLYFPRENWTRNAGRYSNDYRPVARLANQTEEWTFNVETNDTGQTATLTWDNTGLPADRYTFTLVNLDNGDRIDMASQNSYTFSVASGEKAVNHFRIEIVKLKDESQTVTHVLKAGWNLVSIPVDPEITSALDVLGKSLPQLDVIQIYDGALYSGADADIQAGVGYWIHVDEGTEITITGRPVLLPIKTPLKKGWNLVGNPVEYAIEWGDNIKFICGGSTMTLSQAAAGGITDGKLYAYDGDNYTVATSLEPWKGYFVKASTDCELEAQ